MTFLSTPRRSGFGTLESVYSSLSMVSPSPGQSQFMVHDFRAATDTITANKQYVCDRCCRQFRRADHLKRHVRTRKLPFGRGRWSCALTSRDRHERKALFLLVQECLRSTGSVEAAYTDRSPERTC